MESSRRSKDGIFSGHQPGNGAWYLLALQIFQDQLIKSLSTIRFPLLQMEQFILDGTTGQLSQEMPSGQVAAFSWPSLGFFKLIEDTNMIKLKLPRLNPQNWIRKRLELDISSLEII